jgi:hypothetical protein
MAEGIVSAISARTVHRLLQEVDLQTHRTRYWKTAHLDAQFKRCHNFSISRQTIS